MQYLDLTLPVESHHLEGLLPLIESEGEPEEAYAPPRIQTLVLDSSRITDDAAGAISACRDLRSLHLAETRISSTCCSRLDAIGWNLCNSADIRPLRGDSSPSLDCARFLSASRTTQLDVMSRRASHAEADFLRSLGEGRGQPGSSLTSSRTPQAGSRFLLYGPDVDRSFVVAPFAMLFPIMKHMLILPVTVLGGAAARPLVIDRTLHTHNYTRLLQASDLGLWLLLLLCVAVLQALRLCTSACQPLADLGARNAKMLLARASRLVWPIAAALSCFVQSSKAYQVLVSDQDEVRCRFPPTPGTGNSAVSCADP